MGSQLPILLKLLAIISQLKSPSLLSYLIFIYETVVKISLLISMDITSLNLGLMALRTQ